MGLDYNSQLGGYKISKPKISFVCIIIRYIEDSTDFKVIKARQKT